MCPLSNFATLVRVYKIKIIEVTKNIPIQITMIKKIYIIRFIVKGSKILFRPKSNGSRKYFLSYTQPHPKTSKFVFCESPSKQILTTTHLKNESLPVLLSRESIEGVNECTIVSRTNPISDWML